MESASTESDITRTRVMRTVVTRTNYAASGGDATLLIGDVVSDDSTALDVPNSISADVILASGARGTTSTYAITGLDHDLSSFKKRIDANTEEQREHADLMAELQHKVEEYRRRIADIEGQIAAHRSDEKVTFNIKDSTEVWTPEVTLTSGDFTTAQLEEERRRNEEQRLQIARLQAEIQHLQQRYQIDMHDKDRLNQNRERNLAQYLSEEQRRIMDLWAELQQVRRQFADYKDRTARELKAQREEFTRMSQNVGGVVRRLSITNIGENGHDAEIVEAVKRFKHIQTVSTGASVDDYNALMKKYEEAIERIVELETLSGERVGKDTTLDVELKRTRERLTECQEVLRKLHYLAKEHISKVEIEKRARSLSPGGYVVPSEVLRTVRNAMRMHSTEVQQWERKFKNVQLEMNDLAVRFEASEETRKRVEKQLLDAKAEISIHEKAVENANREVRRLEDRLRAAESERSVVEAARVKLDEEIRRLKLIIDQTITDGERKALEQIEAQKRIIEEEYKTHTAELMHRIDTLQDDNRRLKGDLNGIKEKYRNLEVEYNTTLRKIDEKDSVIRHLEEIKGDLLKDLEKQRARFDALTNEYDHLKASYDSSTKNIAAMEMTIKELKHERDEISRQKEDLARQLADIVHKMELEIKKREDVEKANIRHLDEIEKLKVQITEYEAEVAMLRRHNDELDTQLKMSQAKIVTLENSLTSAQKEIVKLNELNARLQKEKNEIMNLKQRADHDIDVLKERVRKLEQEIDKLRAESKALHDSEERANIAYKEEANKVHLLERELQEAKAEIDELKKRLAQMDEANKERLELALRTKTPDFGVYETTHITEARIRELDDKHRLDIERLENERDELARRLRLLEDELAEKQRTIDRQHAEIDELKRQYEAEIERLKTELANLETKYQNELEDERDRHSREIEALKAAEDDLRSKIALLEKKLQEALNREKILQKEVVEWEEKYDTLNKEMHKLRDEIETIRLNAEKEIQKWKTEAYTAQTELKNVEAANETLRAQLAAANERANSLNRTISEQAAKIRDLNSHIRHLEEQLVEAKATAAAFEADLQSTQNRLEAVEQKYANLQLENNKLRGEIDSLNRQIDVLRSTNATNESEIERLKKKVVQLTAINNEQVDELNKIRTERDQIEKAYREKSHQVEQLKELVKTLETKVERMHQEITTLTDKLLATETERNRFHAEVTKLEKELQLVREQLKRKTDDFNVALEDLANAHRVSEDGRVNALQELESRKFEISDLKSRLENAEQRLATLQQEYLNVDKERETLRDSLYRFQSIISRSVIPEAGAIDITTIDVHVQKLLSRMEKLERERNDYRESLGRLQRKKGDSHITVTKHESLYKSIEERIADAEEARHAAEVKLVSAKELLKSQEEALKQRDEERRSLKSKISAFDLEIRGKEAQIRHLNEQVKTLKVDLENSQNDNKALRERESKWDVTRIQAQSKVHERGEEEQRINALMASFEAERQNLNDTLRKVTAKLQSSESRNADLRDDVERLKRDLAKAERIESELRRNLDEQTRLAHEGQHLRDQLTIAQSDLAHANNRKQQLESELMSIQSELRDQKQRLQDALMRSADLERQLQNSNSDKNRLNDRISELERVISSQKNIESELRRELSIAANERKTLQNELEDLRRRIAQLESEKRGIHEKIEELTRIRITLVKKIEILETEKRNAESILSETASQREAIERSLNALERENKELCRNCAQLQQQIAQLESDNGNRLIALTNKQKEEHDRFVQSVKSEKAQVERIIENRDRTQKNRIKQLETQLNIMREQLNNERLRCRDVVDRVYSSDLSKVGSATFGLSTSGIANADAAVYPQTDSFDYVIGSRNAFSSYYTVPSSVSDEGPHISSPDLSVIESPYMETSHRSFTTSYRSASGVASHHGLAGSTLSQSAVIVQPSVDAGGSGVTKKTTVIIKGSRYE